MMHSWQTPSTARTTMSKDLTTLFKISIVTALPGNADNSLSDRQFDSTHLAKRLQRGTDAQIKRQ